MCITTDRNIMPGKIFGFQNFEVNICNLGFWLVRNLCDLPSSVSVLGIMFPVRNIRDVNTFCTSFSRNE
jgi:hypothetical protein